jgi:hypothetical protein
MLADSDGKMERSSLRRRVGWKYSILDLVLEELEKEGRIKIAVGKQGWLYIAKKMIFINPRKLISTRPI